jgi:predicted RNase H-like nuclease (RuvC/YqgF family)
MTINIQQKDKNIERLEEIITSKQNSIDILNDRVKKLEDMFNSRLLPPLFQADQVSITKLFTLQTHIHIIIIQAGQ